MRLHEVQLKDLYILIGLKEESYILHGLTKEEPYIPFELKDQFYILLGVKEEPCILPGLKEQITIRLGYLSVLVNSSEPCALFLSFPVEYKYRKILLAILMRWQKMYL